MNCYCHNKSSAKINIIYPITEEIILDDLPGCIDITREEFEIFTVGMQGAISKNFQTEIQDVINIAGSWNPGGDKARTISCPTTSSVPVYGVYPPTEGKAYLIQISGTSVTGNFDWNYTDNTGSCTYKAIYKNPLYKIIITAKEKRVYEKQFKAEPRYLIACDEDCPPGYIKCDKAEYPGYCCIPCNEIKSGIAGIMAMLRSFNNG